MARRVRTVIMGAGGRDFHTFNMLYRDDPTHEVIAFTAAQIPGIAGRRYPAMLAGSLYPDGIAIHDEAVLETLIRDHEADRVVFAYSDVAHVAVMNRASAVLAAGAEFVLPDPMRSMLPAPLPVIAVCAVRTGCGKSQVARWIGQRLVARGLRIGVIRHPMPYGDLAEQAVQRFARTEDLDAARCTIEEREEYEPHIAAGLVVYAGAETAAVLAAAAAESDVLLWDGGNNDFPFIHPDLLIVLADALRPGHERLFHPGEAVLRRADIVLIAKANAAAETDVASLAASVRTLNPRAQILRGASVVRLDDPDAVRGRRVLVVEDGPTLTHGGMPHGAGFLAARAAGAAEIVDPRRSAAAEIAAVFAAYPQLGPVLPAMGYSEAQRSALVATIAGSAAEVVVAGTPADLTPLLTGIRPVVRARYDYAEMETTGLGAAIETFLIRHGLATGPGQSAAAPK
ncbi:tetraacyldisaccharide 4'-kinase [Elioraea tepidiphila]|uniref:tetraacyldisaccharide 4'-kinase n=1 Tax=Elioraea tepidiphila TaxID=457934 RepID=UPI0004ADEB2E|nr:tetraacyldisaccharide 4'-kinase [Elioraea tepidiphila]